MSCRELPARRAALALLLACVIGAGCRVEPSGPGLGNLSYAPGERFQPIARFGVENGVPDAFQRYGLNVATLHNGYLLTIFAPDSGRPPGGFLLYDVSDPRNPELVTRVYEPFGRTAEFREAHAIGAADLGDGRKPIVIQTGRGIEIWDFADANRPEQLSKLALPGVLFGDYNRVSWQLWWQPPYVYVASSNQGLFIVDARDPERPFLADRGDGRPNPVPPSELGGFRIGPVFVMGNRLIVSSMESTAGFASLDLSDPLNPSLLAVEPTLPLYYATCFDGTRVAAAVRHGGARLAVYDVSDPFSIELLDDRLVVDDQLYCAFQGESVFIGAQERVHEVDVSSPGAYREVGSGTLGVERPDHGQVTAFGNLLFIGNDHGTGSGFIVHDVNPDDEPPRVHAVSPAPGATGQARTTRVGVAFTDNVQLDGLAIELRREGRGPPLPGATSTQWNIANFAPHEPLEPGTTYELRIPEGGVLDYAGNALPAEYRSTFTTSASGQPLAVALEADGPVELGRAMRFSATSEGGDAAEYSFDFGDGTPSTGFSGEATAEHAYGAPGHYTVIVAARAGGETGTASRLVTVHRPLLAAPPAAASPVVVDGGRVYSVNPDNDSVTAVDAGALAKRWERAVGDHPTTLAVSPFDELWVVCRDDATVHRLGLPDGAVHGVVELPTGSRPQGIAFAPDGAAYVTLEGTGELLRLRDSGFSRLDVGPEPHGFAIDGDGARAWVARHRSPDARGELREIDLASFTVTRVVPLPLDTTTVDGDDRARGLPNYLRQIALAPDGHRLWVPSKKDNILRGLFRDGRELTFETSVRTVANRVDPEAGAGLPAEQIDFDNRDSAAAVAFSPLGDYALVALQGSGEIDIRDAYSGVQAGAITDAGVAPQGVAVSADGRRIFVQSFLERELRVYDGSGLVDGTGFAPPLLAAISTVNEEALEPAVLRGKRSFYDASDPRMSQDGYLSCASCHLDGGHDGRVWDFTQRGEGLRNTIDLAGRAGLGHGNLHWTANFDEVQDFENDIRGEFGGTGFLSDGDFAATADPLGAPKAGLDVDLDELAAYVSSLDRVAPSPYRAADGSLTPGAARGAALFAELGCAECHSGAARTDGLRHDVGTLVAGSGQGVGEPLDGVGLETPTLLGLWSTAPYLHAGQASTLSEVLANTSHVGAGDLADDEVDDLVDYLLELDGRP